MATRLLEGQRDARRRLEQIAAQVRKWRELIGQPPVIEPGSSLRADDSCFSTLPASQLAWHGITHAVDHLDAYLHPLFESGLAFALAPQTIARSGILGAAHALWVLDAPTRQERQLRALRLAHEEFRNEHNAYAELMTSGDDYEGMARTLAVRQKWMSEAQEAGVGIGRSAAEVKSRPQETKLIDDVISYYQEARPDVDRSRLLGMYRLIWRLHSGTSHGFRWPVAYRTNFDDAVINVANQTGRSYPVSNDADQLAVSAIAMSLLIERAIYLFDQRRVAY